MIKLLNAYKKIEIEGLMNYYCDLYGKIYEKKGDQFKEITISYPSPRTKDYKRVTLKLRDRESPDNVWQPFPVAYLICGTFRGWKHHSYKVIHIDGDRSNCRADNLKWTPRKFEAVRTILEKHIQANEEGIEI